MVLILAISCSSKIASNPLTPPPTPSPDETEQELLLQIDGVGMDWSDAQVKAFVEKICATVDRLRTKYKVSVLTNPISYYKEEGHGQGDPSVGVNRVHPNLLSEFRYFAQKDIDVYLDIYASDNYTAQNGELGNLPLPKRRYGEPETIKGLNMDLDCFEDIFAKYPNVKGVRFHELIGTHDRRNDGHGFAIEFSLLPEIAQMLKDHERRLVWGDQSWDLCYTDAAGHGFWLDHLNEVCDILGSDLTINFNNNGWGAEIQALTFSRNMANYRNGNLWGTSDQAWWWQEVEAQSLPLWEDGSVRWIGWGPMDMAPELLASFALETFRRGGSCPDRTARHAVRAGSDDLHSQQPEAEAVRPDDRLQGFRGPDAELYLECVRIPLDGSGRLLRARPGDVAGQPLERQTEEIRPDDHHLDRGQGGR